MQVMQNFFSFQTPFKFVKLSTGYGDITSGARDLFPLKSQKDIKVAFHSRKF